MAKQKKKDHHQDEESHAPEMTSENHGHEQPKEMSKEKDIHSHDKFSKFKSTKGEK